MSYCKGESPTLPSAKTQTYTITISRNGRMWWNESEYGNVKDLRIPPSYIWAPDILMYNRWISYTLAIMIQYICPKNIADDATNHTVLAKRYQSAKKQIQLCILQNVSLYTHYKGYSFDVNRSYISLAIPTIFLNFHSFLSMNYLNFCIYLSKIQNLE